MSEVFTKVGRNVIFPFCIINKNGRRRISYADEYGGSRNLARIPDRVVEPKENERERCYRVRENGRIPCNEFEMISRRRYRAI